MTIFIPFRHFNRLRASSFFKPILINLIFYLIFPGLPRPSPLLWPSTMKHNTFLKTSSSSLLKTCPYKRKLFAFANLSIVFFQSQHENRVGGKKLGWGRAADEGGTYLESCKNMFLRQWYLARSGKSLKQTLAD